MIARLQQEFAFIGLGSNLSDPASQVRAGLVALEQLADCHVCAVSGLYLSPPMGPQDQPDYVNAVVQLESRLPPHRLLTEMQRIEDQQGRTRDGEHWGPRTLDLDLLLYGTLKLFTQQLTLPHPGITERAFVLGPLAEIAPELEIPGHGTASACLDRIDSNSLRRLENLQ